MSSKYVNKDLSLKKVGLSKKYRKFMRQMGMKDVYEVPIRKNGMTGSGHKAYCHNNASKLQAIYGGKVVTGFAISIAFIDESETTMGVEFLTHSVWQTPEGKLVDVTLNWKDDDTVLFSPVVSFDVTKEACSIFGDYLLPPNYKKKGLYLSSPLLIEEKGRTQEFIPFSSGLNKDRLLLSCPKPNLNERITIDAQTGKPKSGAGGFTKRSSATGKSWDEIWKRYSFSDKREIREAA